MRTRLTLTTAVYQIDGVAGGPTSVPEPASLGLAAIGLLAAFSAGGGALRRKYAPGRVSAKICWFITPECRAASRPTTNLVGFAVGALLLSAGGPALAASSTWTGATNSDWGTTANWTPNAIPNATADTATFANSATTSVSVSGSVFNIKGIVFNAGADAFTIASSGSGSLWMTGTGITNNSGVTQNFVSPSLGSIWFFSGATAGTQTAFTTNGGAHNGDVGGTTIFDDASVGSASFTTWGSAAQGGGGGATRFLGNSSAGNGSFVTNGSTVSGYWVGGPAQPGTTEFHQTSTAANGSFVNNSPTVAGGAPGFTLFYDSATAGNGNFINHDGTGTYFYNSSTAGHGSFTNIGGSSTGPLSSVTWFADNSNAGNATFYNNGGVAVYTPPPGGRNGGSVGGSTYFQSTASAGSGTFYNQAGAIAGAGGGYTEFDNNSTASNGTFINSGATFVQPYFSGYSGAAYTVFGNTATAGNATLIANAGSNGGAGASVLFYANSTGGTSRVEVFGNGALDISNHSAPGVTIGSLEGTGNVFLGANNLAVGTNGLATTFSGVIQDGGMMGGSGGSLTMTGTGTLVLTGVNTYTGGTTVNGGTLEISGAGTLGAAGGGVTVDGGNLDLHGTNLTVSTLGGAGGSVFNSLAATNSVLTLGTGNATGASYGGVIADNLGRGGVVTLIKTGSGKQTLSGTNTLSGTTTVAAGVLQLAGSGSLSNSSITVAGGATLIDNSSVAIAAAKLALNGDSNHHAVLSGNAIVSGNLALTNRGDVLAPGNSPGTINFIGSQTWNAFTYQWQINDFTGTTAGSAYDQIKIAGALDLVGVLGSYGLDVFSLLANNTAGDVPNFSNTNEVWNILTTVDGIIGFDAANWTLDTSGFSNPFSGSFSLQQVGNDIQLVYDAVGGPSPPIPGPPNNVPEPSSAAIIALMGLSLLWVNRRKVFASLRCYSRTSFRVA